MAKKVVQPEKNNNYKTIEAITQPMERAIFAARWILAPFYIGLILTLILLLIKFVQQFVDFVWITWGADFKDTELALLSLLDLALLGNLVLIVVFAGYENFVSKIESAENSVDRPEWMGRADFSGLKLKLIGSLVTISGLLFAVKDAIAARTDRIVSESRTEK